MDIDAAITAVWHEDTAQARTWFETVGAAWAGLADTAGDTDGGTGGAAEPTWDEVTASLRTAAAAASLPSHTVDAFIEYVGAMTDPVGVVRELGDSSQLDAHVARYEKAVATYGEADDQGTAEQPADVAEPVAQPAVAEDTVEFDQDGWFAYLLQWDGGWDGTEESWPQFVSGFLHHAPDGSRRVAEQFVNDLGRLAIPERVTGLADYGITVKAPPTPESLTPETPAADTAAPPTAAASDPASEPAGDLAGDRASDLDGEPAEMDVDHLEHVDGLAEEVVTPALADLFAEMPEAAELPPERLRELLAEVLHEELAGTAAAT